MIGFFYLVKYIYDLMQGENKQLESKHAAKFFKVQDLSMTKAEIHGSLPADSNEIAFLGTSLTEYFPVAEMMGNIHIKNRGISGNFLKDMTFRIETITSKKPKKIFIEGGINDINLGNDPTTVMYDFKVLMDSIQHQSPNSKLYVHSVLPTRDKYVWSNKTIVQFNKLIEDYCKTKSLTFINTYVLFVKNNQMNEDYTADGLHINANGYKAWKKALEPYIN